MLSVDEGAASPLSCDKCAQRAPSAVATGDLARELWDRSEAWTAP